MIQNLICYDDTCLYWDFYLFSHVELMKNYVKHLKKLISFYFIEFINFFIINLN